MLGVQFADYDERQVGQPAPKLFLHVASHWRSSNAACFIHSTRQCVVLQLRSFFGALYRAVLAAG